MSTDTADIEVGRYALRTFLVDRHYRALLPLTGNARPVGRRLYAAGLAAYNHAARSVWAGGVCVARCGRGRSHAAPAEDCSCGVYGATSLESLLDQFPGLAHNIVAVIAAEGTTIVGDDGLRTSAARVVAYWIQPWPELDDARAVFAEQCPGAEVFPHLDCMLAAYGFPVGPPAAPHAPSAQATGAGVSAVRTVASALGPWLLHAVEPLFAPVSAAALLVLLGAPDAPHGVPATYGSLPDPTLAAFMGTLGSLHVFLGMLAIASAPMVAGICGLVGFLIRLVRNRDRPPDPFHTDNVALLNYLPDRVTFAEACRGLAPPVAGGVHAALKVTTFLCAYALLAQLPVTAGLIATAIVTLSIHVLVTTGPSLWNAITARSARTGAGIS
ncbi:hypothetical protein VXE65_21245 [Mycolicibacterium conceptionense]|uniref:hypothetical protein n=1 Tax=Mycolicibacterium conceptionense TaxID=451644 RepID=UPI003204BD95